MLENSVVKTFGQMDEMMGLSNQFAEVMAKLGRNMKEVVAGLSAITAAIGTLMAAPAIRGMWRLFTMFSPQGRILKGLSTIARLGVAGGAGYTGYQIGAGRPGPGEPVGFLDRTHRTGSFETSPYIGPENADQWS